jgi:PAS domain S-box-containing protein
MTISKPFGAALMRQSKAELADQVMTLTRRLEEQEAVAERKDNRVEQQLRQAVEMLPHPVIIYDLDDCLVFFNQAYHDFFHYMPPLEEVVGKYFLDFIQYSVDMPGVVVDPLVQEDLQAYQAKRLHRLHNPPQGSFEQFTSGRWQMVSEHRIEGLGFFSIRQDITDRVMAEDKLKDAIESISEGFALFDTDGRLIIANSRYKEFYSYSDEDASPGVHMRELRRLDLERKTVSHEGHPAEYIDRRNSKRQLKDTVDIHLRDGRILETRDRKTTSGGIVSIQKDVTEHKKIENELRFSRDNLEIKVAERTTELKENEARFRAVTESAQDAIISADKNGLIVQWNQGAQKMFGYTATEIIGQPLTTLIPGRYRNAHTNGLKSFMASGERRLGDTAVELEALHKDGTEYSIELTISDWTIGNDKFVTSIIRDISERKLIETALRESQSRYILAMEGANDGIWDWDIENNILHISPRYQEMLGLKNCPSIPTLDWFGYIHPEDHDYFMSCVISHLKGETDFFSCEFRLKNDDGRECWVEDRGKALRDATGRVYRMAGSMGEISERKRIQKSLQESQDVLQAFLDSTIDYAGLVDSDGCFLIVNKAMTEIYGMSRDELVGRPMLRLPLSETGKRRHKWFRDVLNSGQSIRATDENEGRWYDNSYFPVYDDEGKVNRVAIFARDITELKETERSLRQLSRAVEQDPNAVFITDTDGTIQFVNAMFTKLTGYTVDEAIGENARLLKSGETPQETYAELWDTIQSGMEWRGEIMDRRKDGSHFWANETIGPVKDENGVITHFVATHEDITHRKEAEIAMRQATTQAEIANRTKSELLANMSHELRTPLNAIIGFSESMQVETFGPVGSDKNQEYLNDIHQSGKHLLGLINDILDVSTIEAGAMELEEENVNITDVVETSVRLIRPRADNGQVSVNSTIDPEIPLIYADARRVKQVFLNLLSNAVKFTPEGGEVTVSAQLNDDGSLAVAVADKGIGMDEEEVTKALSTFGQVDSGLDRKHEGSGLGLPLTKGLMELHGGTMEIQSEKGHGTSITVTFPKERVIRNV